MVKKSQCNWKEIIKEQEVNGKSIRLYCKEKGLNTTILYINRKKVRESRFVEIEVK